MRVRSDHQSCDVMMDEGGRMDEGEWVPIHSFISRSSFNHHASIYSFLYSFNQSITHSFIHSVSVVSTVTQVAAAARCGHPAPRGMRAAVGGGREVSWLVRGTLLGREARIPRPARGAAPRGKRETDTIAAPHASRHRDAASPKPSVAPLVGLVWFAPRAETQRGPATKTNGRPQTADRRLHVFW